jgi:hypothetical protein
MSRKQHILSRFVRRYDEDPEYRERVKARQRKYYREHPEYYASMRAATVRRTEESKRLITEFRKNGCAVCREDNHACLQAHHLDPSKKELNITQSRANPARIAEELLKCICLCANCHLRYHAGHFSLLTDRKIPDSDEI